MGKMLRALALTLVALLCGGLASAQVDFRPAGGGGTGSGNCDPAQWSSPDGTVTVGGSSGACTLSAGSGLYTSFVTGTSNPATCTEGSIFNLRTDTDLLYACPSNDLWLQLYTITDDSVLVGTGTTTASKAIPDCDDSAGQHLNYDTATNAWSCGTSSSGSGVGFLIAGNMGAAGVGASTTTYFLPGFTSYATDETVRYLIVPQACTAQRLYVQHSTQNAGGTLVITVRKNAADTAVTVTIANADGTGISSDTSHTESFAAGDQLSIKAVNNYAGTSALIRGFGLQCQ